MLEKHGRSLIKTVSWRIMATFTTMLIVFCFTRKVVLSIGVGVVEVVTKMVLYYLHERLWSGISWGRAKHPLESLPVQKELSLEDEKTIREQLEALGYMSSLEKEKRS